MSEKDKARFWTKVNQTDYCWEWQAGKDSNGYGLFRHYDEQRAHRIAYQLIYENIDHNIFVCHKCDNPSCVNPDHLWLGTPKDNNDDKKKKGRSRHAGRVSQYYGVTWRTDSKRWRAYLIINKKMKHLGCFGSEIEAAKAHDIASLKEFGKYATVNFPNPPQE